MKKTHVRGTTATYKTKGGKLECDLEELALLYMNIGNVPERLGFNKASEIALLAQAFLVLYQRHKDEK